MKDFKLGKITVSPVSMPEGERIQAIMELEEGELSALMDLRAAMKFAKALLLCAKIAADREGKNAEEEFRKVFGSFSS